MTTLREAAQFALDALHCPGDSELMDRVEQKLRAALAEQEPVGTVKSISGPNYENGLTAVFVHTDMNSTLKTGDPLYTAPQPAKREPLTVQQITEIERYGEFWETGTPLEFARAIERAHGIGEKT